ncbi:hypothetical protein ACIRU3_33050 [Streptomyces sp. NPDC101151]|uniref:hypothetical protein n=1 Tax=Streptomyces sp. NPDC101151 TaxID=3366115 RepID=UPI0038104B36
MVSAAVIGAVDGDQLVVIMSAAVTRNKSAPCDGCHTVRGRCPVIPLPHPPPEWTWDALSGDLPRIA